MLKAERQRRILGALQERGSLESLELAGLLAVSEDTVRRDLVELHEAGKLVRVHGGAVPRGDAPAAASPAKGTPRSGANLARKAAQLIGKGQTVFLGGAGALLVARSLHPELRVTVITNVLAIATELAGRAGAEVVLVGGKVHKQELSTFGPETVEQIRLFRADLLVLSGCSFHRKRGITVGDRDEAPVLREMLGNCGHAVGLAPAGALDASAGFVVGAMEDLSTLVVDESTSKSEWKPYQKAGITVLTA